MQIHFKYDKEKDIWCLLNKGKSSDNNPNPTKVYEMLVSYCGENPTKEKTSLFIQKYFANNQIDIDAYINQYQEDWTEVSGEYHKRAKTIFEVSLPDNITAYLTINNRNPYSITDNLFYITVPSVSARKIIMHELWHFYTWYGLGPEQEEVLGKQKYNNLKEALTVLLNEEFIDLMPEGNHDEGYPQHQKLREEIKYLWSKQKDIHKVWTQISRNN